jgi:hypothetical protein
MQQILAAHEIPARVVSQGIAPPFGCGVPTSLQVYLQDRWTALLLLSPIDENLEGPLDKPAE